MSCSAPTTAVRKGVAWHSTARHGTAQHGTAWHSTAWHSAAQDGAAQHSTAQHSTAQHSTAQHSKARQGTTQRTKAVNMHSSTQRSPSQPLSIMHFEQAALNIGTNDEEGQPGSQHRPFPSRCFL